MRVSISIWARKDRQDAAAGPRAPSRRTRSGLIKRVVVWGSQCWPFGPDLALVVPEPGLPGLEAADDRMSGRYRVSGHVLQRGAVAATDVAALRAAA